MSQQISIPFILLLIEKSPDHVSIWLDQFDTLLVCVRWMWNRILSNVHSTHFDTWESDCWLSVRWMTCWCWIKRARSLWSEWRKFRISWLLWILGGIAMSLWLRLYHSVIRDLLFERQISNMFFFNGYIGVFKRIIFREIWLLDIHDVHLNSNIFLFQTLHS